MESSLMGLLSVILKEMRMHAENGMAQYNLSFLEQMVLMSLSTGDNFNQDSLARAINVDKGTITRSIAKLEAKGLVKRCVNPQNRRENIVALTDLSQHTLKAMDKNLALFMQRAFAGFSEDERKEVFRSLEHIAQNVSKDD